MSTGACLPLDATALLSLSETMVGVFSEFEVEDRNLLDPQFAERISSHVAATCLDHGSAERIVYLNNPSDALPALRELPPPEFLNYPRNRPCPCGSGRKFKHCCGELARRR
jgi:uncharacterized protein YecA (UPF0149 family)